MSLPVRCFTCGKVLGDKWNTYAAKCKEIESASDELDAANKRKDSEDGKTERGRILDGLGIVNMCCRTMMLTTVDMSGVI